MNEVEINDTVPNIDIDDNSTNEEINSPITVDDIIEAVKILKNNKYPGNDDLLNEHLKSSLHLMLPIYLKLFNIILDSGVVPDTSLIGNIISIYKDKGNVSFEENYRPITILSYLGKLFTTILNKRLPNYLESNNIIGDNQSDFRFGFTTIYNILMINCLIDVFKSQKKKKKKKNFILHLLILSKLLIESGVTVYGLSYTVYNKRKMSQCN